MPGRQQIPSFQLASGTTDERDGSYNLTTLGSIFYNTDTSNVEVYHEDPSNNVGWRDLVMNNKEQIDISGKLVVDGIVGIGTTNPTAKLEVNGNLAISGMLKTSNPAFFVQYGATAGGTSSSLYGTTIVYTDVVVDKGGDYNTTSGVFTAPINGIYKFTWGCIGGNANTVYRYIPQKNNSPLRTPDGNRDIHALRLDGIASGNEYVSGEKTVMVELSTNDIFYINFRPDNYNLAARASFYGHGWTYFQGYLISYT